MACKEELPIIKCRKCGAKYEFYDYMADGFSGDVINLNAVIESQKKKETEWELYRACAKSRDHGITPFRYWPFKCEHCGTMITRDDAQAQIF